MPWRRFRASDKYDKTWMKFCWCEHGSRRETRVLRPGQLNRSPGDQSSTFFKHPKPTMNSRIWFVTGLCLLNGLANAGGLVPGFRGMEWGDPMSKLGTSRSPIPKTEPDQYDCFKRTTDKLEINDIPLQEIRYCFNGNKLAVVSVSFDKKLGARVKKAVIEGYGKPGEDLGVRFVTWGDDKEQGGGTVSMLSSHQLLFGSNDAARDRQVDKVLKARKDFWATLGSVGLSLCSWKGLRYQAESGQLQCEIHHGHRTQQGHAIDVHGRE